MSSPSSNADSNSSLTEPNCLFGSIFKSCKAYLQDDQIFSTADEQIHYLLSKDDNLQHFDEWLRDKVVPLLDLYRDNHSNKNFASAKQFKLFADMYANMGDLTFQDKLIDSLNKAIIWAPFSETEFLTDCFLSRAMAHNRTNAYDSALDDLDRALAFSPHCWLAIDRKVALLKRLKRFVEAYSYVKCLMKQSVFKKQFQKGLVSLKKDLKRFKPKKDKKAAQKKSELTEPKHHLSVDDRVEWAMNEWNNRLYLKANAFIPPGVKVVEEDPILYVILPDASHNYCNACRKECPNIFWPCSNCTEVVFCSDQCAKLSDCHQLECGIVGMLSLKNESHFKAKEVFQAYRHLVRVGLDEMFELDAKAKERYLSLADLKEESISQEQAQAWFALGSSDLRRFLLTRWPLLSATDVANAIYLWIIYCFKANIKVLDQQVLAKAIRCISTEIKKVECSEYGWSEPDDKNDQVSVHISQYQCLVSSRVGHRCDYNVEWKFDRNRFSLTTIKPINEGDEISISYISVGGSGQQALFDRLICLQTFDRLCHCDLCQTDACQCFSLICSRCSGPIPFHPERFTRLECLQCEQPFKGGLTSAISLEQDFRAMQRSLWLVQAMQEPDDQLDHIEQKMTSLCNAIYNPNHQFISTIGELCQEYIRLGKFDLAVAWYNWYFQKDIHLPSFKQDDDLFGRLHGLNQWTQAYLNCLSTIKPEQALKYVPDTKHIFRSVFSLMEELDNNSEMKTSLLMDSEQFDSIMSSMRSSFDAKWAQFKGICESANCYAHDEEVGHVPKCIKALADTNSSHQEGEGVAENFQQESLVMEA